MTAKFQISNFNFQETTLASLHPIKPALRFNQCDLAMPAQMAFFRLESGAWNLAFAPGLC